MGFRSNRERGMRYPRIGAGYGERDVGVKRAGHVFVNLETEFPMWGGRIKSDIHLKVTLEEPCQ